MIKPVLSLVLLVAVVAGMAIGVMRGRAIGVMRGRAPISGSCGGLNKIGLDGAAS